MLVTPSRLAPSLLAMAESLAERAAAGLGLRYGPIHAKLRIDTREGGRRAVMLELAARSIGGLCSNRGFGGGLAKGKKMAGHMGAERVTCRSLDVVKIIPDKNLILLKGSVPGANNGIVEIRPAVRLYKTKGVKQKEVAGK